MQKLLLILAMLFLTIGCEKNNISKKIKERKEAKTGHTYKGNKEACIQAYDELWCPEGFKKGSLASGNSTLYFRDDNGSLVILDKTNKDEAKGKKIYKIDVETLKVKTKEERK
jgi:hypothetical protein